MDAATKSMLQFGLIGLALAGGLLGALQSRPATVLPFEGMFSVQIANPVIQLAQGAGACYSDCPVTSLNITIDSVMVHREGGFYLTGGWLKISQASTTLEVARITGVSQLIGQGSFPPGFVNLIRLSVSSASALFGTSVVDVKIPSGKIDVVLSPRGEVKSGKVTTVFLNFPLSINCGGNGECRLRPVLVSRVLGP